MAMKRRKVVAEKTDDGWRLRVWIPDYDKHLPGPIVKGDNDKVVYWKTKIQAEKRRKFVVCGESGFAAWLRQPEEWEPQISVP